MRTREGHGIELRTDHVAAESVDRLSSGPDRPATRRPPRTWLAVGLGAALALAASAVLALTLTGGRDDVVADPPPAGQPAGPPPLGLTVDVPASVVAGDRAELTVRWMDGAGIFSGSSEDWGDAVATSSRKQGRCEPGAPASTPALGTYMLRHTWSEPGTYTAVVAVVTYTCENGSAVEEEAARTLTVEVLPRG